MNQTQFNMEYTRSVALICSHSSFPVQFKKSDPSTSAYRMNCTQFARLSVTFCGEAMALKLTQTPAERICEAIPKRMWLLVGFSSCYEVIPFVIDVN